MSRSDERQASLRRAHYNVLNLDGAEVEVDLFSDVPRRPTLAAVRDADVDVDLGGARAPMLDEAGRAIYGPGRYVWAVRGRAVELAMASALITRGAVVLGNGMFRTTQHAIRHFGGEVELEPGSPSRAGSSDLDLTWLGLRLAEGDVAWVCLEASNNALGGWPASLDNMKRVRELCDRYRVGVLFDATRLLSGCLHQAPTQDPLPLAREMTALSDAFWVSGAKELIAPVGAFLAVRTIEAHRRAFAYTFDEGTWLDGVEARARLLAGMRQIAADTDVLRQRQAQIQLVAQTLRQEGVRIIEPPGAHAIFVPVDASLLEGSPARARALEALLYERAGVRVLIAPYPRMGYTAMLRLCVTVGRYRDDELTAAALAVAALLRDPSGAPDLVDKLDEPPIHDMLKSYVRR